MRITDVHDKAGNAVADHGVVLLDGPNGVAVSMTADAAEQTGQALIRAAIHARGQSVDPS
ncbi:hypothetical protein [Sphingobium sp.]|uniref:hypothetical protein n=1 Tax=Sphingobium sp. TaxID=1912891 RepID=UPI003BB55E53